MYVRVYVRTYVSFVVAHVAMHVCAETTVKWLYCMNTSLCTCACVYSISDWPFHVGYILKWLIGTAAIIAWLAPCVCGIPVSALKQICVLCTRHCLWKAGGVTVNDLCVHVTLSSLQCFVMSSLNWCTLCIRTYSVSVKWHMPCHVMHDILCCMTCCWRW